MYTYQPSFVLGFHGCDKEIGEQILSGKADLNFAKNPYDWLGHGAYFWEQNPERALEFAKEMKELKRPERKEIQTPFVFGAIINLGRCLNLLESRAINEIKQAYEYLVATEKDIPQNRRLTKSKSKDLLLRELDCAVFETLHVLRKKLNEPEYDTVRGAFIEGDELYPGAGFNSKNHIQICVRNVGQINGFFRLPKAYLE